eukprot:9522967-Alexandrium_andersonii.AAC.1
MEELMNPGPIEVDDASASESAEGAAAAEVVGAPDLPGERGSQDPAPDMPSVDPATGVQAFGVRRE